jgi:glycosyltransferase involved in cell wall biosynthesis
MLSLKRLIEGYWAVKGAHPALAALARPVGWIMKGADSAVAGALVAGWALARSTPLWPWPQPRPPDAPDPARSREVCFLSYEGFAVAPTRVRTYYFAEQVARAGVPTRVLAVWDHIFHHEHLPPRLMLGVERALAAIRATGILLDDPPAAIVQQRPNYDLVASWMLHRLRGTPVIFDVDDWIFDDSFFFPFRLRHAYRWSRSMVDVCVVSSAPIEQEMRAIFPRVVLLPTFVDVAMFRPRSGSRASREVVFGWNGTLFQDFMLDALLVVLRAFARAWVELDGAVPVRLEIVGTGGFFESLGEVLATELAGVPIVVKGWIDPRTMNEYLDGIDVGLYSLKEPAGDDAKARHAARFLRSKSPTKVFEYMAKGIPTISTRFGEVARFLEDGVTGFCSDDGEALTRAFVALAKDAALRERMGAAARKLCVESYSLETAGRTLAGVIGEVLAARSPSRARSAHPIGDVTGVAP